jgi:hypothetical protein
MISSFDDNLQGHDPSETHSNIVTTNINFHLMPPGDKLTQLNLLAMILACQFICNHTKFIAAEHLQYTREIKGMGRLGRMSYSQ